MSKKIKFIAINDDAYNTEDPPIAATQAIPDWYKKIPKETSFSEIKTNIRDRGTIKKCIPFLDAMTTGYMLCLPFDIEIKRENGIIYSFWGIKKEAREMFITDQEHRTRDVPVPEGFGKEVWRVDLTPRIKTPKGCSILFTHPFNRYDLPFLTMSGIIDTDKSTRGMTANIYLKESFEGIIEKGTPVAQIFPFIRENWTHDYLPALTQEKFKKNEFDILSKLNRSYQSQFWSKKSYK